MTAERPSADDLRAKVFQDREHPGNWRVEKMDDDRGYECTVIFAGPNARQRAIIMRGTDLAASDEIELAPSGG